MGNSSDLTIENDTLDELLARPSDDRSTEQIARILWRIGKILKGDPGWYEKLRGIVSGFTTEQQEWAAVMVLSRWHRKIPQALYPSVKNFLDGTADSPDGVTQIIRERVMAKPPSWYRAAYRDEMESRSSSETPHASSVDIGITAPHDDMDEMYSCFSFLENVSQEGIDTTKEPARVILQIQEKYFHTLHATILRSWDLTQLQTFWEQFDQVTEWCEKCEIPSLFRFSFVEEEVQHILTEIKKSIWKTSKNGDIKDLDTFLSDEIQKWVKENNLNTYTRNQLLTSELSIAQLKKYIQQDQPQTRVIVRRHHAWTIGRVNRKRK